jgi:mRNA interferase MazF
MSKLHFGDIVLLKFPFSDTINFKKRPALIINEFNDGDIIVCRITSQQYNTPYLYVENWDKVGLKLPSVIRIHIGYHGKRYGR